METMYERIKRMSEKEMGEFLYAIYLFGNKDGSEMLCDSPESSYFKNNLINAKANNLMPSDNVSDLYDSFNID